MKETNCPYCGAELQENAHFCLHCMRSLEEKKTLPLKQRKRLRGAGIAAACLLLASVILLLTLQPWKKRKAGEKTVAEKQPICTYLQFRSAVRGESDRLELGELWDPRSFALKEERGDWAVYAAELYLEQTQAEISFLHDGERIAILLYDIPKDVNDSYWIASCELLSLTKRNEELGYVLADRTRYPATLLEEPFPSEITELYCRTAQYEAALREGTQIQTFYQRFPEACEGVHADFYEIKRVSDGTICYDLVILLAYD